MRFEITRDKVRNFTYRISEPSCWKCVGPSNKGRVIDQHYMLRDFILGSDPCVAEVIVNIPPEDPTRAVVLGNQSFSANKRSGK